MNVFRLFYDIYRKEGTMYRIFFLAVLVGGLASSVTAQVIDTRESQVEFTIGNLGVKTVKGTFSGMKGQVRFDTASLSSSYFDVCIDASTVNTGIRKRDEHLKNKDFFDVNNYPVICFKSGYIVKMRESYITRGKLTMHGITREVTIPFIFTGHMLKGTFSLKRLDYDIGSTTGTLLVSDEVEITITCILK